MSLNPPLRRSHPPALANNLYRDEESRSRSRLSQRRVAAALAIQSAASIAPPRGRRARVFASRVPKLGHEPLRAISATLVLDALCTNFGAVGTPIWFGFENLGLSDAELRVVGLRCAVLQAAAALVVVPLAACLLAGRAAVRRSLAFVVASRRRPLSIEPQSRGESAETATHDRTLPWLRAIRAEWAPTRVNRYVHMSRWSVTRASTSLQTKRRPCIKRDARIRPIEPPIHQTRRIELCFKRPRRLIRPIELSSKRPPPSPPPR